MAVKLENMGFGFGLDNAQTCMPIKNRWLFSIDDVSADLRSAFSINSLPPFKGARPNFGFKEMEVKHLTETVFYPIRPEWKPIQLTLYDIKQNINPVFQWIRAAYDPQVGRWSPPGENNFMRRGTLALYSGCGDVLQEWIYDDCWPLAVNWGELDMGSSEIVTVDVTLRYTRAYFVGEGASSSVSSNSSAGTGTL